jgi:hypothetical protein
MRTDDIRTLIDGGAPPVTVTEIRNRHAANSPAFSRFRAAARKRRTRLLVASGVALAVAGAAAAVTQLSGPAVSPAAGHAAGAATSKPVLTAETIQRVASSSLARLTSGEVDISFRDSAGGLLLDTGTDVVTFSGKNWNWVLTQSFPASPGQTAHTQYAVNRAAGGRMYAYFHATTPGDAWYLELGKSPQSTSVPDPRTVLAALTPAARFVSEGYQVIDGVRLLHLRATRPGAAALLGQIQGDNPGETSTTSFDVWVDASGVVRQMSGAYTLNSSTGPAESTTLTVRFRNIGKQETIKAPAHATPITGSG